MSARQTSNWVSLSDMMTGLMLIFMLIAVLTISQVVEREKEKNELLSEFENTRMELYSELEEAFGKKEREWGVKVSEDLSIIFDNPDVLFGYLSADITPKFREILNEFIPKYLTIINRYKYADKIKEVRIEGHTGEWYDYLFTIELSQKRANAVLSHILRDDYFRALPERNREKIKFWFTANGMGNGRMLDDSGEYVFFWITRKTTMV
jgi:outer membrane protein OmpA-like peptidoglycan-associated protein